MTDINLQFPIWLVLQVLTVSLSYIISTTLPDPNIPQSQLFQKIGTPFGQILYPPLHISNYTEVNPQHIQTFARERDNYRLQPIEWDSDATLFRKHSCCFSLSVCLNYYLQLQRQCEKSEIIELILNCVCHRSYIESSVKAVFTWRLYS